MSPKLLVIGLLALFICFQLAQAVDNEKYYRILGVKKDASAREIKKAYRKLSHTWHPDRARDKEQQKIHHEKMVELNKAFEVLSDNEKRRDYDLFGERNDYGRSRPDSRHVKMEDLFGDFGGFGFGGFSGGGQSCVQTTKCRDGVCTTKTFCN